MRCILVLAIAVTFSVSAVAQFERLFDGSLEHPSIDYADRPASPAPPIPTKPRSAKSTKRIRSAMTVKSSAK